MRIYLCQAGPSPTTTEYLGGVFSLCTSSGSTCIGIVARVDRIGRGNVRRACSGEEPLQESTTAGDLVIPLVIPAESFKFCNNLGRLDSAIASRDLSLCGIGELCTGFDLVCSGALSKTDSINSLQGG